MNIVKFVSIALALLWFSAAHANYPDCKASCAAKNPNCAPYLMDVTPNGCSPRANRCLDACRTQFLGRVPLGDGADFQDNPAGSKDWSYLVAAAGLGALVLFLRGRLAGRNARGVPAGAAQIDARPVEDSQCAPVSLESAAPLPQISVASPDRAAAESLACGPPAQRQVMSAETRELPPGGPCDDCPEGGSADGALGSVSATCQVASALRMISERNEHGLRALVDCLTTHEWLNRLRRRRSDRPLFLVPEQIRVLSYVTQLVDSAWRGEESPLSILFEKLPDEVFSGASAASKAELVALAARLHQSLAAEREQPDDAPIASMIVEACLETAASERADDAAKHLAELSIPGLSHFYRENAATFCEHNALRDYFELNEALSDERCAAPLSTLYVGALTRLSARKPSVSMEAVAAAMPQAVHEQARRRYELGLLELASEDGRAKPRPGALAAIYMDLVDACIRMGQADQFARFVKKLEAVLAQQASGKGKNTGGFARALHLVAEIEARRDSADGQARQHGQPVRPDFQTS